MAICTVCETKIESGQDFTTTNLCNYENPYSNKRIKVHRRCWVFAVAQAGFKLAKEERIQQARFLLNNDLHGESITQSYTVLNKVKQ